MSPFGKMNHVSDKARLPKIWLFYATLALISYVRKNRLVWASMPSVSRLVGTTTISSVFWMGLIRCDCPELL